ncbi:hypothetical protein QE152_g33694, partial [Popillia japonica]
RSPAYVRELVRVQASVTRSNKRALVEFGRGKRALLTSRLAIPVRRQLGRATIAEQHRGGPFSAGLGPPHALDTFGDLRKPGLQMTLTELYAEYGR